MKRIIIIVLTYLTLIFLTIGIIFSQSSNNQTTNDDYSLTTPIENISNIPIDSNTLSFLMNEQKQILNVKNPDEFRLLNLNNGVNLYVKNELNKITTDFLINVDIPDNINVTTNVSTSTYVEPSELRGYNFIIVEYQKPITSFDKKKEYYRVFLNDEYVGNTNEGPCNDYYRFFPYNLVKDKEYKIKMEKMIAFEDSKDYSPAMKAYQLDRYLEDIIIENDTDDRVVFLLIVLMQKDNKIEAIVAIDDKGDKYLNKKSSLWKVINKFFLNAQ